MTCREVIEFLSGYLDGELAPDERAKFDRHLVVCPSCVAYLQTYQATIRIEKAVLVSEAEASAGDIPEELVRAILAARNSK